MFSLIAIYIACSYFSISKWFLLLSIASFLFFIYGHRLRTFFLILAAAAIILPLTVLSNAYWLVAIGAGLLGMVIGYDIWWSIISGVTERELMTNEALFEGAWTNLQLALRIDGNLYIHKSHRFS
ncbi:MAG: hypothetical protein GX189_06010 [Clostridiales bacterium]|nr:hypothetical protein [Clostridiales bacterium]